MGIPVLAPDVNESMAEFTASNGKIRFGLSGIKNVGHSTVQAIIEAREEKGNFESIFNFCEQVEARKLNRRTFESLIKSGAFDSLGRHRACLMESVEILLSYTSIKQKSSAAGQHSLFALNDSITMPTLSDVDKWQEKEVLANEMEVLGFYVTSHPMAKYSSEINNTITNTDTEALLEIKEKCEVNIAGVVRSLIIKNTKSGSGIYANLVLEDMKGSVEVVIFDKLLRRTRTILEEKVEPVIIKGIAEPNEDQVKLRALDIISLRGLRNGSVVHIRFNKASSTRDNFEQLSRILDKYPGNCEVHVHINTDDGESVLEVGDFKVDVEDSLISEVEKLLGEGAMRFV
jgi:DNA polymerase-3 subunit alpha